MAGTCVDRDFDSSQYWADPELSDSEVLGRLASPLGQLTG